MANYNYISRRGQKTNINFEEHTKTPDRTVYLNDTQSTID